MNRITVPATLVLALAGSAVAATLDVPGSFPSIQAAVDAAMPGDTVLVAPGIYHENVDLKGAVSLVGSGWKQTIIDGGGNGNVVQVVGNADVQTFLIRGFTLRNSAKTGSSFSSCGVFVNSQGPCCAVPSNGAVEDCRIEANQFGINLVNVWAGTFTIQRNIIVGNEFWGIDTYLGSTIIRNNTIVANRTGYRDFSGNFGQLVTLENNIIAFNSDYGVSPHSTTPVSLQYNDVFGNGLGDYVHSNGGPFSPAPGTGEISVDPQFFSLAGGDYYLTPGSPVVGAGNGGVDMGALPFDASHVPATLSTFGSACGGLAISADGYACLESPLVIGLAGAPPATPVRLAIGASDSSWLGVPLPLNLGPFGAPGCTLLTGPLVWLGLTSDAAGGVNLSTVVPNLPSVVGIPIFMQWHVDSPGANALGILFSDALTVVIGT